MSTIKCTIVKSANPNLQIADGKMGTIRDIGKEDIYAPVYGTCGYYAIKGA